MRTIVAPVPSVAVARARRRRWRSPVVALSLGWLAVITVLVLAGPELAPHASGSQDLLLGQSGPSSGHFLGTDALGRDIFSRVLAGTRTPVLSALAIAFGAALISTTFGLIAGYIGGLTESVIMRGVDLLLALPGLLVIIVVIGAFNGGYMIAVLLLALLTAPWDTRIIRGVTLEQRPRAYVEAARVMGLSSRRIMVSHLLPNILPLIVVNAGLDFAGSLVALSGLSFVGLTVGPGTADWGRMLFENRDLLPINPWAALAPAVMIVLTAAAANIAADSAYARLDARGRAR